MSLTWVWVCKLTYLDIFLVECLCCLRGFLACERASVTPPYVCCNGFGNVDLWASQSGVLNSHLVCRSQQKSFKKARSTTETLIISYSKEGLYKGGETHVNGEQVGTCISEQNVFAFKLLKKSLFTKIEKLGQIL